MMILNQSLTMGRTAKSRAVFAIALALMSPAVASAQITGGPQNAVDPRDKRPVPAEIDVDIWQNQPWWFLLTTCANWYRVVRPEFIKQSTPDPRWQQFNLLAMERLMADRQTNGPAIIPLIRFQYQAWTVQNVKNLFETGFDQNPNWFDSACDQVIGSYRKKFK